MQSEKLALTAKEICELCGFSRTAFDKLRRLGVFKPLFGLRRCEKYSRQQLLDWVNGFTPKQESK